MGGKGRHGNGSGYAKGRGSEGSETMAGKGRRGKGSGYAKDGGSEAVHNPPAEADSSVVPCGQNPAGVFVHKGSLYISESLSDRVVRIQDGRQTIVAGGNGKGRRLDQFDRPYLIFVNDDGVYVADRNNARVQFWSHGATTGETVAGGNGPGHGAHQLNQPTAVAVDGGHIYVADRANHRIMRWAPGSSEGVLVAGGNGFGPGSHQLGSPGTICIAGSVMYIACDSGARVQRWVVGDKTGTTVAGGHGNGSSDQQLYHPFGITLMGSTLLVCDSSNHRVQQWSDQAQEGTARTVCGGFGPGSAPGQLDHPVDCFWDGEFLYVSDFNNACVRSYAKETLDKHAKDSSEEQYRTQCDGKRYTGRVVEWRDRSGYGFVIDDVTERRYMAHNADIANSLVQFGYAVLTEGEHVEYALIRDFKGKWKCDALTAPGGGPVSPDVQAIDMSINSGYPDKYPEYPVIKNDK